MLTLHDVGLDLSAFYDSNYALDLSASPSSAKLTAIVEMLAKRGRN